jgi:hypothetical protein
MGETGRQIALRSTCDALDQNYAGKQPAFSTLSDRRALQVDGFLFVY